MVISTNNFISDSTLLLRTIVSSGVTDPISGTRPSNTQFVVTAYPEKTVAYPHISIQNTNISSRKLGMASELSYCSIPMEIRVWALSIGKRDDLTEQTINTLRKAQYGAGSTSVPNELYNFDINSAVSVSEPGKGQPKSKVIQVQYNVVLI